MLVKKEPANKRQTLLNLRKTDEEHNPMLNINAKLTDLYNKVYAKSSQGNSDTSDLLFHLQRQ